MPRRLHDRHLALERCHVGRARRHERPDVRDGGWAADLRFPGGIQIGRGLEQGRLTGVVGLSLDAGFEQERPAYPFGGAGTLYV